MPHNHPTGHPGHPGQPMGHPTGLAGHQGPRPKVAIVNTNTLAVLGLKQLLQELMPMIEITSFRSFDDLKKGCPDEFFHYFVAQNILMAHRQWFMDHHHKTIVLSPNIAESMRPAGFHCLCTHLPVEQFVKSLLLLIRHAHSEGRNLPEHVAKAAEAVTQTRRQKVLTDREIEVLSLIVRGLINKEIADKLHIGLTTVITHRKNIMEKLGVRSVSALTMYAVMHGYVDVNKI